jgi:hypothetical protein
LSFTFQFLHFITNASNSHSLYGTTFQGTTMNDECEICVRTETIPGCLNCFWLYGVLPLAGMHSLDQVNHSDLLQHDFQQSDLHRLTKIRLPLFPKAMCRLRYREYTKINSVHCCLQFLYLRRTVQYISPCRWIVREKKCYRRGCPCGDS